MSFKHDPEISKQVRWSEAAAFAVVIAASIVPFIDTIRHVYFMTDDFAILFIAKNMSPAFLADPATYTNVGAYAFFRPVGLVTWWLNYMMYGFDPVGYHLTNVLLHAACAALVVLVVSGLSKDKTAGFVAGMVFAVHPIHTEAINWLSCRYDILATMFFLAAFFVYVRRVHWGWTPGRGLLVVCALEALALMSKEMALTFPIALLAYELFYPGEGARGIWRAVKKTAPYFAVAAGYFALRFVMLHGFGGYIDESGASMHKAIAPISDVLARLNIYIRYLAFGIDFTTAGWLAAGISMLGAYLVSLLYFIQAPAQRKKLALFFVAAMFISFLPVINFSEIHIDTVLGNSRFMYLPSSMFAAAVGLVMAPAARAKRTFAAAACVLVTLVCFTAATMHYNGKWVRGSETTSAFLRDIKTSFPDSIDGFDITVYTDADSRETFLGKDYFLTANLSRALILTYDLKRMKVGLEHIKAKNVDMVKVRKEPRPGYKRRLVFMINMYGVVLVYDSGPP